LISELLQIAKLCDRRNEWTEEQWIKTLTNCVSKSQYILIVEGKEIIGFSCWLFIKDLNKVDNKYIEHPEGKIAYIQCAYVKEGHKGLLNRMIRDGVEDNEEATHIFFCDDEKNNRKFLIPINKWRRNEETN